MAFFSKRIFKSEQSKSARSGETVRSEEQMLLSERKSVADGRGRKMDGPWLGLAMSGGGIRSATFCLGAMQRLARGKLLKHFDYISSVSGGGYAASAVQWKWHDDATSDAGEKFPFGTEESSPLATEKESLKYLRWHASYLAPGGGISIWSLIAVLLRTLFISLFVWLPIATLIMLVLIAITGVDAFRKSSKIAGEFTIPQFKSMVLTIPWSEIQIPSFAGVFITAIIVLLIIAVGGTIFLAVISILIPPETTDNRKDRIMRAFKCFAIGLIGVLVAFGITKHFNTNYDLTKLDPVTQTVTLVALGLGFFGSIALVVALLQFFGSLEFGVNYAARRKYELLATPWFYGYIAFAVLASLPYAFDALRAALARYPEGAALFGSLTAASGFLSGLYGHFVQAQRLAPNLATRAAATLLAAAFLYLMLVLAYAIAWFLIERPPAIVTPIQGRYCFEFFAALVVFSFAFAKWSNLNYLGLHRFYRDRLMEAFLPTNEQKAADAPNYSDADRLPLAALWPPGSGSLRPYPLVNTNAIMIDDPDQTLALRGGTSFLLSPLHIGSQATGWLSTHLHDKRHGPLTLASAMAASGAAANANAGYIGTGVTRDRLISIVMNLFNFRLGLWIGAPRKRKGRPNYISPGLIYGVLRLGYRHDSSYLELTDGGHFDNLGIYELIRRRCSVIVVLDSEEDPSTAMSALASACQRIHEDFNVVIKIGTEADALAPAGDMGYPSGAKFAKKTYFLASICYPAEQRAGIAEGAKVGVLVYLKAGMIKELSFAAKGYKAKNPDFPNQSTMDQFFDSAQFEAYRELGYASVDTLLKAYQLDNAPDAATIARRLSPATPPATTLFGNVSGKFVSLTTAG